MPRMCLSRCGGNDCQQSFVHYFNLLDCWHVVQSVRFSRRRLGESICDTRQRIDCHHKNDVCVFVRPFWKHSGHSNFLESVLHTGAWEWKRNENLCTTNRHHSWSHDDEIDVEDGEKQMLLLILYHSRINCFSSSPVSSWKTLFLYHFFQPPACECTEPRQDMQLSRRWWRWSRVLWCRLGGAGPQTPGSERNALNLMLRLWEWYYSAYCNVPSYFMQQKVSQAIGWRCDVLRVRRRLLVCVLSLSVWRWRRDYSDSASQWWEVTDLRGLISLANVISLSISISNLQRNGPKDRGDSGIELIRCMHCSVVDITAWNVVACVPCDNTWASVTKFPDLCMLL